ncbi:PAS domain-containing protein [Nocardia crassostreae]|uniref:PAS domain-containing protein n=1 Tax=Nocardia crassostreae TaxID=53428 RepID=UPI000832BB2E|nr:PAS domain S-box protein [Nocardia crassostreae]
MADNANGGVPVDYAAAVVASTPDAVVVLDAEGIVRLWNGGAERIFGYTAAEAIGRSLDLIIPEKQRAAHWAGYRNSVRTGLTRYGDRLLNVPALHRDGHRLSVEFSVALLCDEDGAVVAVSAVMRDVSQRRSAERQLRLRLAELEQRLAAVS